MQKSERTAQEMRSSHYAMRYVQSSEEEMDIWNNQGVSKRMEGQGVNKRKNGGSSERMDGRAR